MSIYLTYRDIPEMQSIPESDRWKTWQAFLKWRGFFSREALFSFGPFVLLLVAGAFFLPQIGIVAFVLFGLCGPFASAACYVSLMRRPFREFLTKGV